jgi:hypothetical protein
VRWESSDPDQAWSTRWLSLINILQGHQCRYYSILEIAVSLIMRSLGKVECLSVQAWPHGRICSAIRSSHVDSISLGRIETSWGATCFCGPYRAICEPTVLLNQFPPLVINRDQNSLTICGFWILIWIREHRKSLKKFPGGRDFFDMLFSIIQFWSPISASV